MFDFFKKKKPEASQNKTHHLYAVATGELIPITEVKDPVFSQKMMGDGFAVVPENGEIYSPVRGTVASIFKTKHAVGFKLDNGLEVLLHMGLDTVELNGGPFELKIAEGDKIEPGQLVALVDLAKIEEAGKGTEMVVVVTNMEQVKNIELTKNGSVIFGEEIGSVESV